VYFRTGTSNPDAAGSVRAGQITLDASQPGSQVVFKGDAVTSYAATGIFHYVGDINNNGMTVQACYQFGADSCLIGAPTVINGFANIVGDVWIDGAVTNRDGFAAVNTDGKVAKTDGGVFTNSATKLKSTLQPLPGQAQSAFSAMFTRGLYAPNAPGDEDTITQAMFSFRDDPANAQYGTAAFALAESRWQQMVHLKLGTGGTPWVEPTVTYQGRPMMPYPGNEAWTTQPSLLQLKQFNMCTVTDSGSLSMDRPGPYLQPSLAGWTNTTPAKGFLVLGP
jgi:hypothetical protein